jgi:RNA polymerase sigma-70 factor (ECF subfamily)
LDALARPWYRAGSARDEAALIRQARGGSADAIEALVRRHWESAHRAAFLIVHDAQAAEDIAQEAMLAAYRRWDEVSRLDLPAAWVRRVCANIATSFIRRRIVEARAALRLPGRQSPVVELDESDGSFWAEVRRLPRRQAQCVALRYVYGCSVAEVAGILGCADGTVKAHLSHGRARLAERLGETVDERPA